MKKENKLKTLKDLNLISRNRNNERVFTRELKAEAVKWVEELKGKSNFNVRVWIIKFFNITEEDLK